MHKTLFHNKIAVIITALLCLIFGVSLFAVLYPAHNGTGCIADIYQDGELLCSVPLDGSHTLYRFSVIGEDGCSNEIEVRPHSIGIISADCPDKLCVHQGFIESPGLPIVCLPNKLVIQLRETDAPSADITAY